MRPSRKGTNSVRLLAGPAVFCLLLGSMSVCVAQPPVLPPADKTLDQIWEEISVLEILNAVGLTHEQLQQIVPTIEGFRQRQKDLRTGPQAAKLRAGLWAVRMAMLKGEDAGELWEKVEGLDGQAEAREKAEEDAVQESAGRIDKLLTDKQRGTLVFYDTPHARIREVVDELPKRIEMAEEEWLDWRNEVAAGLAEIAADQDPKASKGVNDRVLTVLLEAKTKGAAYAQQNAAKLRAQLTGLVLPADQREGPSPEEREERIRGFLHDMLHDEPMLLLLKEKLALGPA